MYDKGWGVAQDFKKALELYRAAAAQGNAEAEQFVCSMYSQGQGVDKNYSEAVRWCRMAAEQGDADAQYDLGNFYDTGEGVPQSTSMALGWLVKAADQGNAAADTEAGMIYIGGPDALRDMTRGLNLLWKAADQNNSRALTALGKLYVEGHEYGPQIQSNLVLAYMLFDLAAAQGDAEASKNIEIIAPHLIPEQLADAQSMASGWKPGTPLPRDTTYEDLAPQLVLGELSLDELQVSRIWFSRDFTIDGHKKHTVFIVSKGEDAHAYPAHISAVTFTPEAGDHDYGLAQFDLFKTGSYGDVQPQENPSAKYDSPDRVRAHQFALAADTAAIAVETEYSGMGIQNRSADLLVFHHGEWKSEGVLPLGENNDIDCSQGKLFGKTHPDLHCYSWAGEIITAPARNSALPEIIIKATGTEYSSEKGRLEPARDVRFVYDGNSYVEAGLKK